MHRFCNVGFLSRPIDSLLFLWRAISCPLSSRPIEKNAIFVECLESPFAKMTAAWQSPEHDVKDESSALHSPDINPDYPSVDDGVDDGSQDDGIRDRKSDSLWWASPCIPGIE